MKDSFAEMLAVGGKSNSLGRADEVIANVLQHKSRLAELYDCLFNEDAWVRMRAADSLEKVCRVHPDWLVPYVERFLQDLATSDQPSIQWHLAQIFREVDLTAAQKRLVIAWLIKLLSSTKVDWIVAANSMDTLAQFTREGAVSRTAMSTILEVQQQHRSAAVVKRASKLLKEFTEETL